MNVRQATVMHLMRADARRDIYEGGKPPEMKVGSGRFHVEVSPGEIGDWNRRAALASSGEQESSKTGWPPGLLQDDCKGLSKWFASRPDARRRVREALAELEAHR